MSSPGTVTLAQVRLQAQYRADMINSNFVSTTEWDSYISNSYKELYDLLVAAYGNDYFGVNPPYNFTTDGVNMLFPLPSDFYKLLGVDLALSTSLDSYVTIRPFMFGDRNRYAVPNFQSFYGITNLRYRIYGNNIWLTPIPANNQIIRIWYINEPTSLTTDTQTFDGVSGWEEYIIIDAAIKALQKEESDVSVLMAQKQAILVRIEAMANTRDAGAPAQVGDAQYSDFWWQGGNYSGNGSGSG